MPPRAEQRELNKAKMEADLKNKYGHDTGAAPARPLREGDINDTYELVKLLREGNFAKVYEAKVKETDEPRAIKVMQIAEADSTVRKAWLAQEIEITRRVTHKNIVHLHEVVKMGNAYYLVYERMDCDLWEFLRLLRAKSLWITEWHTRYLMRCLLDVVAYLHSHNIVHRDIKPENLLMNIKDGEDPYEIRLTDFGIAKVIDNKCTPFGSRSYLAPEIVSGIAAQGCDTDEAEKVLMTRESVKGLDLWSCGIVLYFLLVGDFPPIIGRSKEFLQPHYRDLKTWEETIFPERSKKRWGRIDIENRQLILSLLSLEPTQRPSAAKTLKHPFFTALDAEGLASHPATHHETEIDLEDLQAGVNSHVNDMREAFDQHSL
eukprot:TRINITY_DN487_c0_g2_i1.p1 TRINITY_DN487_c0_g2~~TRINITY_DN487_c0_g2_i1.p1  ORF type:complete len:412 (+),score=143.14 TRINITY_DN487_c0_g2_i1:112-1236(+)